MGLSLITAAILLCAAMLASGEDPGAMVYKPMPRRPERFGNADQFSNYLKELQDYYAVHGRGRYGKRQMRTIMQDSSVLVRDVMPPPVYFRNLQYYGNMQQDYDFDK